MSISKANGGKIAKTFTTNTEVNSIEHCNFIISRNEEMLEKKRG